LDEHFHQPVPFWWFFHLQQPPTTTNIKDPADAMNEPVAKYSTLAENV